MAAVNERLAPAEPRYYTWSFPGSPVKVQMDLAIVKRIEEQVRRCGAAMESGLLFGAVDGHATVISDSQALSQADAPEIRWAIAAAAHAPVGYYRIRRQGALQLDSTDLSLAETLFRDAHQVFLLIQPAQSGPPNATFFFRDGGRLNGDFPFLEFPFDSELLAKAERHRIELAQRKLEPEVPAPAAPLPAAPPPPPAAIPDRRRPAWKGSAWILFAACLLAAVAAAVRWVPRAVPRRQPSVQTQVSAQSAIGLQAVRQDADVKLTWDRTAAVVINATSGVLSIQDGDTQRVIPLSAAQVHDGSILYSPVHDQVQMWLTVSGPAATAVESVIVIDPRTASAEARSPVPRIRPAADPPELPTASAPPRVVYLKPFSAPADPAPDAAPAVAALDPPPALAGRPAAALEPVFKPIQNIPQPAPPPARPAIAPPYYPPRAIHEVTPNFPISLRSLVLRPTLVEVMVSIDTEGNVAKAEAVPRKGTHQLLIHEALLAAHEWKFLPARRGDQAIPSEMLLRFNFKPAM